MSAMEDAADRETGLQEPVLRIEDLRVRFGSTEPVSGVSLALRAGERIGLVGESGSGKSLTALSIMRLAHGAQLSGRIDLQGTDLLSLSERQMSKIRGRRVAMVYQDPMSSLNPAMRIGAQLTEAIRLHESVSKEAAIERAIELLDEVGVPMPEHRIRQYPHELSGGMRQRVMIAMALASRPEVLIADEPTTALDVTTQARIIDLLDRLATEHNTAVILITHDLGVAAGFCEFIHVMRDGKIIEAAPAQELYDSPRESYTRGLLSAVVDLDIPVDQPIPTAGGQTRERSDAVKSPPQHLATEETCVRVEAVSKTFTVGRETIHAVKNVSFEIPRGTTYGLVGESGSGKSTVSRAVLGLSPIDAGRVIFDGVDIHTLKERNLRPLRRRMQMVFQDPLSALNRRKTVEQLIAAPLIAHRVARGAELQRQVQAAMDKVGLPRSLADRLPHTMSGGQCQRVAIARAIALDPEFLVLDESVSALDVSIQAQVLNLLRELQSELGLTYLFISHDLAVVRYMATRLGVMRQGELVEEGTREEMFSAPRHPYTRALMAAIPIADPHRERERRRTAASLAAEIESDADLASETLH